MDVKNDQLLIQSVPYDLDTGDKLEPEQVPATRKIVGAAPMRGDKDGALLGMIPASMRRESDAIEFANQARSHCGNCRHFDQPSYQRWVEKTNEGRAFEEQTRTLFAQDFMMRADDPTLVHAMKYLGFCRVLTEIHNDLQVTRPDYPCPGATIENPLGFWDAATSGDAKIASAGYDHILGVAQGTITPK